MNNVIYLDSANLPQELKLILEMIKLRNDEKISEELYKDIDWDLFLQLTLHHRVYPMLYPKTKKIDHSWIPLNILQSLNHYYRTNTFQMLHLSGEMEHVSRLFSTNDIRSLFLKGPVLAADLYGDISLRTCGDLDILIPIEDLTKADQLLVSLGYEKDEYIKTLLNDWKWRHHHVTYYHSQKGIKLEIHWRLNPAPGKEPGFNELWDRKRKSSIMSCPTYFLGEEDLFLFLCTHGARHGWSRLRWLLDIHQIAQRQLNWHTINRLLKKYHCDHIGGQSLILSSQLLSTPVTKDMQRLIEGNRPKKLAKEAMFYMERMVSLHTDPVPRDVAKYHARHLFSLMSSQQKFLYFLSVMHPYYADAETLPLPKKFHFLYFPLRPFLWIWRKARKHALT